MQWLLLALGAIIVSCALDVQRPRDDLPAVEADGGASNDLAGNPIAPRRSWRSEVRAPASVIGHEVVRDWTKVVRGHGSQGALVASPPYHQDCSTAGMQHWRRQHKL